ncbi:MAG: nucleotidyltransferase family protein [Candidatus Brocadiaceae bacterium]
MSERIEAAFVEALCRAATTLGLDGRRGGLDLARRFGLEGLAVRHGLGDEGDVALRDAARVRRFYEDTLRKSAREISAAFEGADIPHAFVRGITLIGPHYRPGDREMADLDLHTPVAHASAAVEVLQALGFLPLPIGQQSGPPLLRPGLVLEGASDESELARVTVDLHWGLEPVERIIARPTLGVPPGFWEGLGEANGLPCPGAEHHLALLVHHLVHHDLLHPRGILDFALVLDGIGQAGGWILEQAASALGVLRAARAVHEAIVRDLAATPLPGVGAPPDDRRGSRLRRLCRVESWLLLAAMASEREWREITPARIRRRMVLADRASWGRMVKDALWPPARYLAWRWPDLGTARARVRHVGRAIRKLAGRPT